jgi:hypothetical protein
MKTKIIPIEFVIGTVAKFVEKQLPNTVYIQNQNKETGQITLIEVTVNINQVVSCEPTNIFNSFLRMKQIGLLVVVLLIIFLVEKIYYHNTQLFGTVNVLPGIGVVSSSSTSSSSLSKKKKIKQKLNKN